MPTDDVLLPPDRLRDFVERLFLAAGSPEREARLIADHLVESNLKGHDSHGVGSIPAYVRNIAAGELPLGERLETVLDSGAMLLFDGRGGFGQVMAHDAIARGIARAKEGGVALVGLRNSHHIGRIGHWAEQCAAETLVSIHFVNVVSEPTVAPFGGRAPRAGTNPFAVGIPRQGAAPIILDFATSKLAVGKVRVALNTGKELPPGAVLTPDGEPTTDPATFFGGRRGILLPFGDHKGWGLSLACELLGAALTGGATQSGPKKRNAVINCMLSIIVSPEKLGTESSFFDETEKFLAWVKSGANAEVLLAGEPEAAIAARRRREGVPVDARTWEHILAAAREVGLVDEPVAG